MNHSNDPLPDRSRQNKPPVIFPKRIETLKRIRLIESPDALTLTDFGATQRIAVWAGTILAAGLVIATMVSLVQAVAVPAPSGNPPTGQPGINVIGVVIVAAVVGSIIYFVLGLILRMFRIHRRFSLHVQILERRCVCRSQFFGFTTRRINLDVDRVKLQVGTAALPVAQSDLMGSLVVRIGLIALGPFGWLILLAASLSRSRTRAEQDTQETIELVGLIFSEADHDRFVVAMTNEELATQFVLAWDRAFT